MSTGLLSGTSVIVSFSYGALLQGEAFSRTALAVCAILILVIAIIAYAAAGQLASTAEQQQEEGTHMPLLCCAYSVQHPYKAMISQRYSLPNEFFGTNCDALRMYTA